MISGICTARNRTLLAMLCTPFARFRSMKGNVKTSKSGVTGSHTLRTIPTKCPTTSLTSAMGVTTSRVLSTRSKHASPFDAGQWTTVVCVHEKRETARCLEKPYSERPILPSVSDSDIAVGSK